MAEYIDKDALLRELNDRDRLKDIECWGISYTYGFKCAMDMVSKALPLNVTIVKRGLWMPIYESEMTGWDPEVAGCDPISGYICSICKEEAVYDCNDKFVLSNYCPNCGARMDGGDNDADD